MALEISWACGAGLTQHGLEGGEMGEFHHWLRRADFKELCVVSRRPTLPKLNWRGRTAAREAQLHITQRFTLPP